MRIARFPLFLILMLPFVSFAGSERFTFDTVTVPTNGAGTVTNTSPYLDGDIDSVYIDIGANTAAVCRVDLVAISPSTGPLAETILSVTNVSADAVYRPRLTNVVTTANVNVAENVPYLIAMQKLQIQVSASNATGMTVAVTVKYRDTK